MHWWEKWPGRLEAEAQAFVECGIPYEIDSEAKEKGLLIIQATFQWEKEEIPLTICFPDNYPYFPPKVTAPKCNLRHQEPREGGLCLLAQEQDTWDTNDTIAEVISRQLPDILRINEGDPKAKHREEQTGIPIGAYMNYEINSHLLLPELPENISRGKGTLDLRLSNMHPLRGIACSANDETTNRKIGISAVVQQNTGIYCNTKVTGYWAYLSSPPSSLDAKTIIKEAEKDLGHPLPRNMHKFKEYRKGQKHPLEYRLDIYAFAYHDELEHEKSIPTWIVVARRSVKGTARTDAQLIRSHTESRQEVFKRIPEARPLEAATVTCIGLGSIGSPIAIELAKAGVGKIHLVDSDIVEPGNSVRWASGFGAAGHHKSLHIAQSIKINHPYTQVGEHIPIRIGSTGYLAAKNGQKASHDEILHRAISDSDLIIDSSASTGVHHYLSSLSRDYRIPHIIVSSTHGAWGGRVARLTPGETGCWSCLLHYENDGSIPTPSDRVDDEAVQPHGCLDPTFTGTSFDLMSISMMATRLAVATLCRGSNNGYPDYAWDYSAISFRAEDASLCTPSWKTSRIKQHPRCASCQLEK
ncbi:ThiF family adenylyltransferase [Halomonas stenophila]|uniref:Molybdopterin/thiamine biosynthesis adenylyltransferase n=1 Tax=Halomonas stenophila TaxID=795312 RepID=A0A7W5EV42_9GAMM|nr:ThiF family adenylyltransferase [Halomonas stenophila]MBB3231921.1 molybdopterin/thiamine biosynthesis adenylyltransferase [Halomonas stenophila]